VAANLARAFLLAGLSLLFVVTAAEAELRPIDPFAATEVAPAPPSAFSRPVAAPFQAPGPLGRLFAWVFDQQQSLQRMLATSVKGLAGPFSWRKVMAVVFSVGIRPCTGAILVLVFAVTQGLFWAGSRRDLRHGARHRHHRRCAWANAVWTTCSIGGATIILLFGLLLFAASLGPARPF
jgi:hypothetical protein